MLWAALREKRKAIAEAQDVPAYMIFPDTTLMAMFEARPKTLKALQGISGIGTRKLEQYGQQFLEVIQGYDESPGNFSDTSAESVNLFRLGYSIGQICQTRGLKEPTIYKHLAEGLEQGLLVLTEVVELPPAEIASLEDAILQLSDGANQALKPVFDSFAGQYSYEIIRCVKAALLFRMG